MKSMRGPIKMNIAEIVEMFFTRISLDESRVQMFVDLYEAKVNVKPLIVSEENELIDGRHRLEALRRLGRIQAMVFVAKTSGRVENIVESVRANLGEHPLPANPRDLQHAIELLINNGLKKSEIMDMFPLEHSMTGKYYRAVQQELYKRRIGRAVDSISRGDTILQAADKYNVPVQELRDLLKARKDNAFNVGQAFGQLAAKNRGYGQMLRTTSTRVLTEFKGGMISGDDVKEYINRITEGAKRIHRNAANVRQRLTNALAGLDDEAVDKIIDANGKDTDTEEAEA